MFLGQWSSQLAGNWTTIEKHAPQSNATLIKRRPQNALWIRIFMFTSSLVLYSWFSPWFGFLHTNPVPEYPGFCVKNTQPCQRRELKADTPKSKAKAMYTKEQNRYTIFFIIHILSKESWVHSSIPGQWLWGILIETRLKHCRCPRWLSHHWNSWRIHHSFAIYNLQESCYSYCIEICTIKIFTLKSGSSLSPLPHLRAQESQRQNTRSTREQSEMNDTN